MHRSPANCRSIITFVCVCILSGLLMASEHRDMRSFNSTVDWYKPPPRGLFESKECIAIPSDLVRGVATSVFGEAVSLLRNNDILELAPEQARQLAPDRDPEKLIATLIKERERKLRWWSEHPAEGFPGPRELLKESKASEQRQIKDLKSEINQFERWKHHVKPYLIRAVALQRTEGFSADLCGDDLLVNQLSLGGAPLPMKRMPVIAFLPKKPQRIYASVSMME